MKKKSPIENAIQQDEDFYASAGDTGALNKAAEEYGGVYRSQASYFNRDFSNLTPNVSGRPGLTRGDYDQFRPEERVPKKHKDIIKFAEKVYKRNGLIRNIIDLMGDFTCQGIRISCANKRDERFYKNWFAQVKGPERSERFSNNLYRTSNIIIRRQTATVDLKNRAKLFRATAKSDLKIDKEQIIKAEIPWSYLFLSPTVVDIVGDEIACFANKKVYALTIPSSFKSRIGGQLGKEEKALLSSLPPEVREAIVTGNTYKLPDDKTLVFHYKKDDWEPWATPMTYAIFDDIILLEKHKLADSAALDGAITKIRIFSLGHLGTNEKDRIMPGAAAAAKLKDILGSHTMGGTIDIVWGPDIKLIESAADAYKFLGQEKYKPALDAIYGGMGIPATLTGSGENGGATNNFISLQTLIQRLEYGRQVLLEFWNQEISIVQKAMGLEPAVIEFDYMDLGDPDSKNALLIQLSDRSLISDEVIQHEFKLKPSLELARINRENEERESGDRPDKTGPFPDHSKELEKGAVNKGYLTPKQVGLKPDQLGKRVQNMDKTKPKTAKTTGVPGQGRPQNSKDSTKRKQKAFKPKSKASLELWASSAQDKIAEILNPAILHAFNKKNMRSLTSSEAEQAEKIKFGVLFNILPFTDLNQDKISAAFVAGNVSAELHNEYHNMYNDALQDLGRELTSEETRRIQTYLYGEIYEDYC